MNEPYQRETKKIGRNDPCPCEVVKSIKSAVAGRIFGRISVKLTKIRRSDIFHLINPLISCNVIKTMKFLQRVLSYFSLKHHEIAEIKKKICKFET